MFGCREPADVCSEGIMVVFIVVSQGGVVPLMRFVGSSDLRLHQPHYTLVAYEMYMPPEFLLQQPRIANPPPFQVVRVNGGDLNSLQSKLLPIGYGSDATECGSGAAILLAYSGSVSRDVALALKEVESIVGQQIVRKRVKMFFPHLSMESFFEPQGLQAAWSSPVDALSMHLEKIWFEC